MFTVSVAENEVTASPDNTLGSSDTPAPEGQETIPPDGEESSKPGTEETIPPDSGESSKPGTEETIPPDSGESSKPGPEENIPPEGQESSKPGIGEIIPPSSKPGTSEIPSPSTKPSASPSAKPSASPTIKPSATPTIRPTIQPTAAPVSTVTAGKWKNPSGTSLKKLKAGKKMVTVKWKQAKDSVGGYEVQYATNKAFTKGKKTRLVAVKKNTSVKVFNLKARKKYYFRIRTYRTLSGEQIYSKWSKVKSVKTK